MHFWWFGNDSLPYCHCEHPWNACSFDRMILLDLLVGLFLEMKIKYDKNTPPRVVLGCEGYFTIHALEYHGCNSNRCSSQHCPGCTQTPALWQLGRTPALPRTGWKDENGWRWMDIHHIFFNHTNQKTWSSKTSDRHASQLTFLSLLLRALFIVCVFQSMKSEQLS